MTLIIHPPFIQSPMLNEVTHGFFGRQGGVSQGLYDSLNTGIFRGDVQECVLENRRRMLAALGVAELPLLFVHQHHTNTVVRADLNWDTLPIADAIVTDRPNIMIAIQTADCVPVLLADADKGVIGAVHAGWKGLASGILQNTIAEMEKLGANRSHIKAAIGPCVWQNSYEVGDDVRAAFPQFDDLFVPWREEKPTKTYGFDMPTAAFRTLTAAGIVSVNPSPCDTYSHEDHYFSYRRSTHQGHPNYGCQASIIGMIRNDG